MTKPKAQQAAYDKIGELVEHCASQIQHGLTQPTKRGYVAHAQVSTNAKKLNNTSKTMTENRLCVQTISTQRTGFQADRVLLLGRVTEKNERADPSHF